MSLQPGQILENKYRIVRMIGEGGMGSVHEGENTRIRRRVAIKVLHAAASASPDVLTRFEREAQAAGCIGSDHILEVLDLGSLPNGDRYMVMEYLDGEALAERIKRLGRMAPHEVAPLLRQALVGLQAAHAAGIVHRDLKPDNIFIIKEKAGRSDYVKIIDFGISKFNALNGDMSMTRTGAVMGTPYYMSPEQAKGAVVDQRTDIYALGVILYEALTGVVPFDGTSFNDLMFKIVLSDAPPLPDTIEVGFAALVRRAMARDPAERFGSAAEFMAALDAWTKRAAGGFADPSPVQVVPHASSVAAELAPAGAAPATPLAEARTGGNWAATRGNGSLMPPGPANRALLAGVALTLLAACAVFVWRRGGSAELGSRTGEGFVVQPAARPGPAVERPALAEPPLVSPPRAEEPAVAAAPPAADDVESPREAPQEERGLSTRPSSALAAPEKAQTPVTKAKPVATSVKSAPPAPQPPSKKPATPDFGY